MTEAQKPEETKGTVAYDATNALTMRGKAQAWAEDAAALTITSATMFEAAATDLQAVLRLKEEVEAARTSITKPMNDALRAVNALFKPATTYLETAEATLKRTMLAWTTEQEALARKAREEAEARDRKAREDAAAQAAELQRQADAAAARASNLKSPAARARAEQQAQELLQQAQAVEVTAAVQTSAPSVYVAPAKASGISTRTTWGAEVTDLKALVAAVHAGTAPLECLCGDMDFLTKQARAFKREDLFPGVKGVATRGMAARK